jgi:hypothetical protein
MDRIKQWTGMFVVALALAVLLTRFAGIGTETADAASTKTLWIGSTSLVPADGTVNWTINGSHLMGDGYFYAPITLPAGKKIMGITIDYLDNDPDNQICATVWVDPAGSATASPQIGGCSTATSATPATITLPLSPSYKLLSSDVPFVAVFLGNHVSTLRLYTVGIMYK